MRSSLDFCCLSTTSAVECSFLRILTMSVLMIGSVLCVTSKIIIGIFADDDYYAAWQYMPLLTLAVIFLCMGSFIGNIFMAEKKSKYFFYSSLWGAIASIVFTISFIKIWGLMGVCLAIAGSFLVMFVLRVFYAWHIINQFSVKHYAISFALYVGLVIVTTFDTGYLILIMVFILYVFFTVILNRQDIRDLIGSVSLKRNYRQ